MRAFANTYEDLGQYKHGDFSRSSGCITTREDPIQPYIYINTSRGTKFMLLEKLDKASISVNRGTHFQVHFVWQVWDSWLSPAFESERLKAFGGWKFDRGTPKLHASILTGKGAQKKKPNMFTVGSSTSATFVLPVHINKYTHTHSYIYIYTHKS